MTMLQCHNYSLFVLFFYALGFLFLRLPLVLRREDVHVLRRASQLKDEGEEDQVGVNGVWKRRVEVECMKVGCLSGDSVIFAQSALSELI